MARVGQASLSSLTPDVVPRTLLAMTSHCISKALVTPVPLHTEPHALLCLGRQPEQAFPPELLPSQPAGFFFRDHHWHPHSVHAFDTYPGYVPDEICVK